MKIKIMHILYSFGLGGLENGIVNLINHMDGEKFAHSICVFHDDLGSMEKIKNRSVNIHIISRTFRHDPSVIFRLRKLLLSEKPDIVRTYNWAGIDGIIAASISGIKLIVHSEHGFDTEEVRNQKFRRILIRRYALKLCSKIIVVSREHYDWANKVLKITEDKLIYIPNGCDTDRFFPGENLELRRRVGLGEDDIVIGTVGTFDKRKNQVDLVEAFAKLVSVNNKLRLVMMGRGPEKARIVRLVKEMNLDDKTIFMEPCADTAPFYRMLDIFALVSLYENLPNVILEAMATALPIVSTDTGDVALVLGSPEGGAIVKIGDINGIALAIELFTRDPDMAGKRGLFARKRVEERFGLGKMVSSYEELYYTLLDDAKKEILSPLTKGI